MNGTVVLVESVPEAFADLVARGLADAPDPAYSLFLSGGGTAAECYRALAARRGLPWDRRRRLPGRRALRARPTTPTPTTG